MKKKPSDNPEDQEKKVADLMVDKATETFKWWNNLATLNKEDSTGMSLLKIGFRIVGVAVLIAISPIAILAVFIAFLAVL